ncbi:MAG TPA: CBS domain-containing protein [Haliangiales bacterium]|nr:CBS domain-containing protein [Haliangiales bacterium]
MTLVKDLMRRPVTLPEETAEMGMVEAQMKLANVRHVLLVDAAGRLSGILSRGDLMRVADADHHHSVKEYMTRRLFTVRPEAPAVGALDLLLEHGVGAVPVVDGEHVPVGLVSEVDYLQVARRALAG